MMKRTCPHRCSSARGGGIFLQPQRFASAAAAQTNLFRFSRNRRWAAVGLETRVRHGASHTDDPVSFTAQPPRADTPDRSPEAPLTPSIVRANVHDLNQTSTALVQRTPLPGRGARAQRLLPAPSHPDRHEVVSSTPRKSHPCSPPVPTTSLWWRVRDGPLPSPG